ncbi:hypothetical protein INS49_015461 [Diaporthe citri]|uniref:uncharacterized protein n=1 Tax=Diaporthe citri TaxID=83186 RepID=UPI001C806A1A|nr:uncharacterized protein INS49_015461 [Diaporthe citri]KAG6356076.1 hypothetical protein INS49_015461 [Diaporthe citri]
MEDPTRREAHRIEIQRLIIRTAVYGDALDIAALRGDRENNPYGGADSNDPEVCMGRISRWQKANAEGRYAFLVILLRDSGRLIGFGGYNEFRWINLSGDQTEDRKDVLEVEIGAQIDHRYWRQGYAREAFVAMLEYAFNDLGPVQISCDTNTANEPWRGLMQSFGLGAKEEKQVNSEGHPAAGNTSLVWRFTRAYLEAAKAANK